MGLKFTQIILVAATFVVLSHSLVYSQSTRFIIQDSTYINRVSEGDTIPEKDFQQQYFSSNIFTSKI